MLDASFSFILVLISVCYPAESWIPSGAPGNLWAHDPFLLPPPEMEPEQLFIRSNSIVGPIGPPPPPPPPFLMPSISPFNVSELSGNMFNLYFGKEYHEVEDNLEYFRHDLGVNLFHHHWHSANPFNGELVANDRRGESFYYMHQQFLARYNTERLANGEETIPSVHDYVKLESHIEQTYQFPEYDVVPFDALCQASYDSMQEMTNNIIDAINQGYAIQEGTDAQIPITVDLLGNMIQPSSSTPNTRLYGGSHNMGHYNIAYCHFKGNQKVNIQALSDLGDTRTAPRSPVFYRFHTYVDDIFKIYLNKVPEYTKQDLDFPGMIVKSAKTVGEKGAINLLETFNQKVLKDEVYDKDALTVEYNQTTHIQHEDFHYEITVKSEHSEPKIGFLRIFLAAKYDVDGKQFPLSAQRNFFIELDKFPVTLNPGNNTIKRSADESVVTVKFDEMFRLLAKGKYSSLVAEEKDFCACGWPDYFLIPRGNQKGMAFQLFVMVSDFQRDSVEGIMFTPPNPTLQKETQCKEAYSYCGKMESLYPDRAPMGYPWDRPAPKWASSLKDFCTPNMLVEDLVIKYNPETVLPPIRDIP